MIGSVYKYDNIKFLAKFKFINMIDKLHIKFQKIYPTQAKYRWFISPETWRPINTIMSRPHLKLCFAFIFILFNFEMNQYHHIPSCLKAGQ